MENFTFQENQYFGECLPCTAAVFNNYVDDPKVAWKIKTRRTVEEAISNGLPLDRFAEEPDFKKFCQKKQGEKGFADLTLAQKLLQWATSLKSSLPCFIFGVKEFEQKRRKLSDILHLSGFFMFDADKMLCDPENIFRRTQVKGFPWKVVLAHKTSSGHGLRLVCEARPELGNIADNQICLARDLNIMDMRGSTGKPVVDDSCIDATRISYCPCRDDIYYIDEKRLFNMEMDLFESNEFDQKFVADYKQGKTQPTKSENNFPGTETSGTVVSNLKSDDAARQLVQTVIPRDKPPMVFDHDVRDFINTIYPNGAPVNTRHKSALKLASDLMIILDGNEYWVKEVLLKLPWVQDVIKERGEKEIDDIIDTAKKQLKKRESECLYDLRPSREMQKAIEAVVKRKYTQLVAAAREQQAGGVFVSGREDIVKVLERIGAKVEKYFKYYPLLRLMCHGLQRKHYIAALFVGSAFCMNLMTRMWYQFWSAPGKKCRMNHLLELIGRQGSGKRFAVTLYEILMEPIKKADQAQIDALNRWKAERSQNNGAAKNKTPEPKGIYRALPSESSAAGVRDAEVNAKEMIDGEEWYLHISQFDSELQNTLSQLKKGYFSALYTLWLKGFHNEPHGALLKSATSIVGEWPVHYNVVYTGTQHALDQQVNLGNYATGLNGRITAVPMGDTNFEMMKNRTYSEEDRQRDEELKEWAYKLDMTQGEIPCKGISDALHDWTARRMEDAKENQSLAEEDLLKRPCWHAINYTLPFIVSRHWDMMVEKDGRMVCGAGFCTDKTDRELALLICNAQYTFQQHFFGAIAEQHYDDCLTNAASKTHHQQRTLQAYRRLPDTFTSEDVKREYGYDSIGSVCSRLKHLQDDGLAIKIRKGEDKGKYRKLL